MPHRGRRWWLDFAMNLRLSCSPDPRYRSQQKPDGRRAGCATLSWREEDNLTLAFCLRPVVPAGEDGQVVAELLARAWLLILLEFLESFVKATFE